MEVIQIMSLAFPPEAYPESKSTLFSRRTLPALRPAKFGKLERGGACVPSDCLKRLGAMRRRPPGGTRIGQVGREKERESGRERGDATPKPQNPGSRSTRCS